MELNLFRDRGTESLAHFLPESLKLYDTSSISLLNKTVDLASHRNLLKASCNVSGEIKGYFITSINDIGELSTTFKSDILKEITHILVGHLLTNIDKELSLFTHVSIPKIINETRFERIKELTIEKGSLNFSKAYKLKVRGFDLNFNISFFGNFQNLNEN
jgi:chemotaxis protein CheY-P-specific phosphatase CheC